MKPERIDYSLYLVTDRGLARGRALLDIVRAPLRNLTPTVRAGLELRTLAGTGTIQLFVQDIVPREASTSSLLVLPSRGSAWLADIGTSHPLWSGVAGLSLQNIGHPYVMRGRRVSVPTQLALGWTAQKSWGPLDFGYATQVTARRHGWISPAAGVEVSWSWIEGYRVEARTGARRTETNDERPVGAGFSFTADRLTLDYGASFYTGNAMAHRLTVRWR